MGTIAAKAILGRHPYDPRLLLGLLAFIREHPVDVPDIADDDQALLIGTPPRVHEQRWGQADLHQWLSGASPEVPVDDDSLGADGPTVVTTAGFAVGGDLSHSPIQPFDALQREWREPNGRSCDLDGSEAVRPMEWPSEEVRYPVAVDVLAGDESAHRTLARLAAQFCRQPRCSPLPDLGQLQSGLLGGRLPQLVRLR